MRFEDLARTEIGTMERREPVIVKHSTQMAEVVSLMARENRGVALITDDGGKMLGIFTEHDLSTRVDLAAAWRELPVAEHMTKDVTTATHETSIAEALALMTGGHFRHLPIISDENVPLAVISIRDVIAHIAGCFPKEFLNLPSDPEHEASSRWGG